MADEHVDHVDVILQQVRPHAGFSTFLFLMTILQIGHGRGFGCLVAKDRIDQNTGTAGALARNAPSGAHELK
jgi:hypothetical protein